MPSYSLIRRRRSRAGKSILLCLAHSSRSAYAGSAFSFLPYRRKAWAGAKPYATLLPSPRASTPPTQARREGVRTGQQRERSSLRCRTICRRTAGAYAPESRACCQGLLVFSPSCGLKQRVRRDSLIITAVYACRPHCFYLSRYNKAFKLHKTYNISASFVVVQIFPFGCSLQPAIFDYLFGSVQVQYCTG